jgi:hypothetical protein
MDNVTPLPKEITLKRDNLPLLAERYAAYMETQQTRDLCACEWVLHPDDAGKQPGYCRECGGDYAQPAHQGLPEAEETHTFRGVRMRKGEEAPLCPVHTKAGFALHFIAWSYTQ